MLKWINLENLLPKDVYSKIRFWTDLWKQFLSLSHSLKKKKKFVKRRIHINNANKVFVKVMEEMIIV